MLVVGRKSGDHPVFSSPGATVGVFYYWSMIDILPNSMLFFFHSPMCTLYNNGLLPSFSFFLQNHVHTETCFYKYLLSSAAYVLLCVNGYRLLPRTVWCISQPDVQTLLSALLGTVGIVGRNEIRLCSR